MLKKRIKIIFRVFNDILNSLISIVKVVVLSGFYPKVKKIDLDNIEECYVLGNGPSLETAIKSDVKFFSKKHLMVVNNFALTDYYAELKPRFYIFADPSYWITDANTDVIELRDKIFDIILKKTSWKIHVLIPYDGFKKRILQDRLKENAFIKIVYYNSCSVEGFSFLKKNLYKQNLAMPGAQNVLIAAIFLSMNIGFKRIGILGADHSWIENMIVNFENQVCLTDRHFYDMHNSNVKPWLKISGEPYKMHEILHDLSNAFKRYHELKLYGDSIGVEIINFTKRSHIDAFKRKDISKYKSII